MAILAHTHNHFSSVSSYGNHANPIIFPIPISHNLPHNHILHTHFLPLTHFSHYTPIIYLTHEQHRRIRASLTTRDSASNPFSSSLHGHAWPHQLSYLFPNLYTPHHLFSHYTTPHTHQIFYPHVPLLMFIPIFQTCIPSFPTPIILMSLFTFNLAHDLPIWITTCFPCACDHHAREQLTYRDLSPEVDTWHASLSGAPPSGLPEVDTWHTLLSGATPPRCPKEGHVARSSIRTPSGRSTRHSQTSHSGDRHILSGYVCPDR